MIYDLSFYFEFLVVVDNSKNYLVKSINPIWDHQGYFMATTISFLLIKQKQLCCVPMFAAYNKIDFTVEVSKSL